MAYSCSVIKRDEIRICATVRLNPQEVMLSERSQTQKFTYCMSQVKGNTQNKSIHRVGTCISTSQGLGGGSDNCVIDAEFLFEMMKRF